MEIMFVERILTVIDGQSYIGPLTIDYHRILNP